MSALIEEKEAKGKLAVTRAEIKSLFDKKADDGRLAWEQADVDRLDALEKQATAEVAEAKKWEERANLARDNDAQLDYLRQAASAAPIGGDLGRKRQSEGKSIGQHFVESAAFKNFLACGRNADCKVDLAGFTLDDLKAGGYAGSEFKTTMSTGAGFAPFSTRNGDNVPYAFRRVMIPDLMPSIPTGENAVLYMEETTHTSNAAATLENSALPESAIAYTQRTVNIEDVGTSLPVSERMLNDAPYVMGLINSSLGDEVARAEETQLVTGTGTSPQLMGFLSTAAATAGVQTQAIGGDDAITAFMKAMVLVQSVGYAEPSAGIWHPLDWQDIVTLKDTTGRFIFGDPSQTGPRTLWGLPAVVTTAITQNTCLVGDFRLYAYIARRAAVSIEMGWQNTDFVNRVRTIRAYGRSALVIRRKAAFCKITGV